MNYRFLFLVVAVNLACSFSTLGQQSGDYGITGNVAFPLKKDYDFQLLYMEPAKTGTHAIGVFRFKWKGEQDATIWGVSGPGQVRVLSAPNGTAFSLHVGSNWKPIWAEYNISGEGNQTLEHNKNYIVEVDLSLMTNLFKGMENADAGVVYLVLSDPGSDYNKHPHNIIVSEEFSLPLDFSKSPN